MAMTRQSISTILLGVLLVALSAILIIPRFARVDMAAGPVAVSAQRAAKCEFPVPSDDVILTPDRTPRTPLGSWPGPPTNVVLFIGDGMGMGHLSTASTLTNGPGGGFAIESAPVIGLIRTWPANKLVTGSAASATSMATGFKTDTKRISQLPGGANVTTLFEAAQTRGMATGAITTSGIVDATPAAFIAHAEHRDSYGAILQQLLQSKTDVMIGGDFSHKKKAIRQADYMDLVENAENEAPKGLSVIRNETQLPQAQSPYIALLPPRPGRKLVHGPRLAESVTLALEDLGRNPNGFVLLVESEDTDEGAHASDIPRIVDGLIELDEAVEVVLEYAATSGDTLVLVTADHDTGSPSITSGSYDETTAEVRMVSDEHLANWVPLFAWGPGAVAFSGVFDNTEIARRIAAMLEFEGFPPPSRSVPAG
jgi:alkaline phosphatase